MLDIIAIAITLAYFMLIWLRTDAFVEYMNLLRLGSYLHIDEYTKIHRDGYGGNYVDFLFEYYKDSFFVRLFSCPICLSFWLGVIAAIFLPVTQAGLIGPLALFFYLVFNRML